MSAVALAAGVLVGSILGSFGIKLVATALIVIYLVALLVFQFVRSERKQPQEDEDSQAWVQNVADEYGLSDRERMVFELLAQGHGESFVAEKLGISPNTVKTHRKHIYRKLGISSREELIEFVSRFQPRS